MLRVAILDHHPAVRSGLRTGIETQAAMTAVGAAADRTELWPLLEATHAEVLVLGQPARGHATEICRQARTRYPTCRVVLYATPAVAVPAVLAGAHALVDRSDDLAMLVDAIWIVASGGRVLPALTPEMSREAAKRLTPGDQAIMAMLLADTAEGDVAMVTGLSRRELQGRRAAIVAALAGRRVALDAAPPLAA
jgi:DNA-binding NarL/FixJ family response regulator